MHAISEFIERELLCRRSIILPFIGELALVRHGAVLSSDGGFMTPPYDTLELDGAIYDPSRSLPDLLGSTEIYNEWYYSCLDESGTVLWIEGVCSIDLNCYRITVCDRFSEILQPTAFREDMVAIGRSRVEIARSSEVARACSRTVKRRSRSNFTLTVALILFIGALLYLAYTFFVE